MISGYIMDMDGTIIDSMTIWDDIGSRLLLQKNITPASNLKETLAPLSINQAINYLIKEYHLQESVGQINQQITDLLDSIYSNEVTLKTGAKEFINNCYQKNKKLCLLTANNYQTTIKTLDRFAITEKFHQIITCDSTSLDKQNGDIYKYAAKQLNLNIDECIVIEDAYHAIKSAKNAGFKVWAVADQSNQQQWDKICKLSDQHFTDMKDMEVL